MLINPLLTIAVPTFNRAASLKETLNLIYRGLALLSQEQREGVQIIVANNASTDNTREICSGFKGLNYFEQKKNLGYDENINTLYEKASGDWIFFLSDDDIFEYTALPALIKLLERSDQLDVIFCNWYSMDFDGVKIIHTHKELLENKAEFGFYQVCKFTPFFFLSSFLLRRAPIKRKKLMRGTYATQMEIALQVLSRDSRCAVFDQLLVCRLEPATELKGGNCDSSIAWKIHLGFTNVRRKFQNKFGIELSPVAELSSALSSWGYVKNQNRPISTRLKTLISSIFFGIVCTKPSKLLYLPAFILNRYLRVRK